MSCMSVHSLKIVLKLINRCDVYKSTLVCKEHDTLFHNKSLIDIFHRIRPHYLSKESISLCGVRIGIVKHVIKNKILYDKYEEHAQNSASIIRALKSIMGKKVQKHKLLLIFNWSCSSFHKNRSKKMTNYMVNAISNSKIDRLIAWISQV